MGFLPRGWDLGFEAGIYASKLGFGLRGDGEVGDGGGGEGENSPYL